MRSTASDTSLNEITIFARVLANGRGRLSPSLARYLLTLGFDNVEKARMRELAVRNQDENLSPTEKDELFAYAKAGTLLSILKSHARRALRLRPNKRNAS